MGDLKNHSAGAVANTSLLWTCVCMSKCVSACVGYICHLLHMGTQVYTVVCRHSPFHVLASIHLFVYKHVFVCECCFQSLLPWCQTVVEWPTEQNGHLLEREAPQRDGKEGRKQGGNEKRQDRGKDRGEDAEKRKLRKKRMPIHKLSITHQFCSTMSCVDVTPWQ